jgi:hypothetical protein
MKALAIGVVLGLFAVTAAAQDTFSRTELRRIKPVPAKTAEACARFEATFSGPLQGQPRAVLDIGKDDFITGAISVLMDVIRLSPERYELRVNDAAACKALQEKAAADVTVTGGQGADGRPIFPAGRTVR